jgi:hypothetical protein
MACAPHPRGFLRQFRFAPPNLDRVLGGWRRAGSAGLPPCLSAIAEFRYKKCYNIAVLATLA